MVKDLLEDFQSSRKRAIRAEEVINGTDPVTGEAIQIDIIGQLLELIPARAGFGIAVRLIYRSFRKQGFNWWQAFMLTKLSGGQVKKIGDIVGQLTRGVIEFDGTCLVNSRGKTLICLKELLK